MDGTASRTSGRHNAGRSDEDEPGREGVEDEDKEEDMEILAVLREKIENRSRTSRERPRVGPNRKARSGLVQRHISLAWLPPCNPAVRGSYSVPFRILPPGRAPDHYPADSSAMLSTGKRVDHFRPASGPHEESRIY